MCEMRSKCGKGLAADGGVSSSRCVGCHTAIGGKPPPTFIPCSLNCSASASASASAPASSHPPPPCPSHVDNAPPRRIASWRLSSGISGSLIRKPHLPRLPHQQPPILLRHFPAVIPQQRNPLQLPQILAAIHPKLPRTRKLLPKHREQPWILRRQKARQNRHRPPLLRRHVLRDHAGAA